MVAKTAISEGELVMVIPRGLMMSCNFGSAVDTPEMIEILRGQFADNGVVQLALLVAHGLQAPGYFYKSYLQSLPTQYTTPLYWNEHDFDLIENPISRCNAINSVRAAMMLYVRSVKTLDRAKKVTKINPKSARANPLIMNNISWDLFRWSMSVVMTRQNHIPYVDLMTSEVKESHTLIPMWDMMNHEGGKMTTLFDPELDSLEYRAMRAFEDGSEITMHYGDRSNEQLLIYSGFVSDSTNSSDDFIYTVNINISDELTKIRNNIIGKYVQFVGPRRSYDVLKAGGVFSILVRRSDLAICFADGLFVGLVAVASKEELVSIMRLAEDYTNNITSVSGEMRSDNSDSVEKVLSFVKQGKLNKELVMRGLKWVYNEGNKRSEETTNKDYGHASKLQIGSSIQLMNEGHRQMTQSFMSFLQETTSIVAAVVVTES